MEDSRPSEMGLRQMIREWLLLLAKCPSRVYIEKDFSIRSDEPILIDAKQNIPLKTSSHGNTNSDTSFSGRP